jgi:hypothetical protein
MTSNITSTNKRNKRPRVRINGAVKINGAANVACALAEVVARNVTPRQLVKIKKAWGIVCRQRLWVRGGGGG